MRGRIGAHVRSNLVAYLALFFAITGGTAYALDGSNSVFSDDIVNGEVRGDDLAANSVGSGKIADRQVKNADLSIGASSSNTIADDGVRGIDVKDESLTGAEVLNDSLTGRDIDEGQLDTVNHAITAGDADKLDGIDSSAFVRGEGRVAAGSDYTPGGSLGASVISPSETGGMFNLLYECPADTNGNGLVWFVNSDQDFPLSLFVDNGSDNPSFIGTLAGNGSGSGYVRQEPAAASGEYLVFQAVNLNDGRTATVHVFSHHEPSNDRCYAQAQAVVTRP